MQAGQTGHYVLSTIHTIDSIEVITRLKKMGLSNYDISSTLATAISQRLVRKLCPKCKKQEKFDLEWKTYDAPGCKYCNNTGYYDRIGIFEVLSVTDEIKELIVKDASSLKSESTRNKPLVIDGIQK